MATKTKKSGKMLALKIIGIIVAIIAAIAIIATIFVSVMIRPVDENSDKVIYVGGMVSSETIDFKSEASKGMEKNQVIRLFQMIWRFCDAGDKKKHAAQTPPKDKVTEIENINYMNDNNHYHELDVFYPNLDDIVGGTQFPVIIDVHGGGWMYADKDLNDYYCMALAERGFVVFNISYRLAPDVTVPEQLQDVANALKWISDNMYLYPCDMNNITLTGDSAGGQLSIYSSIIMQSPELQDVFGTVNPNMNLSSIILTSPVSFMKSGGYFSLYTKPLWGKNYKSAPTYNYMDLDEIIDYADSLPPVQLITSSGDSLANAQTHRAYELLIEKGYEAELIDIDKDEYGTSLPHVFAVLNPFDEAGSDTITKEVSFVNTHLNK